jgi:alpha-1,2-mannosyltransferase
MAGLGLALFVCAIIAVNAMQPADKALSRRSAGHDFLAFYTAGTFVRTGRSSELYDLPAVRAFQQDLVAREGVELNHADDFGPFWNPPIFAWVFAPLSTLPYATAGTVWTVINLCCLVSAITILCRILGGGFKTWGLVPLLVLTSMPLLQSIGHGQNTCISLLILSISVSLWRHRGVGVWGPAHK